MKRGMDNRSGRCDREHRKADGDVLLETRRAVFIRRGRRALLLDLLHNGLATSDDVIDAAPLPPGIEPRCLGSVPGPLARANIIRAVARDPSVRPGRYSSHISLWVLVDRGAAKRWLEENPDGPSPEDDGDRVAGLQSKAGSHLHPEAR